MKMAFQLSPTVTPSDLSTFIPQLFNTIAGRSHLLNTLYPDNATVDGQNAAVTRFINQQASYPCIKWLKVIDLEANGDIVAVSQWYIIDSEVARQEIIEEDTEIEDGNEAWSDVEEQAVARAVYRAFKRERREVARKERLPILCLNLMSVLPKYQRKGAGKMMMEWAMKQADQMGALGIVESNDIGRKLYEQFGFVAQGPIDTRVDKPGLDERGFDQMWFMTRPRDETGQMAQGTLHEKEEQLVSGELLRAMVLSLDW
ncbi:hypothetical protein B0J11DRAFT_619657 [Dendryphion nanum]|uniref:N-acetyltransferase domain-containing protein n=1 Tax=Dendryphion nanum TaxID=256645 RepID=A0A9P9IAK7_9PLEO|nr:hypothetical protein B0J11DRAFT_619657 [Dendryphion nanum]